MVRQNLLGLAIAGMLFSVAPSLAQEREPSQDRDRQRSSRSQDQDSDRFSQDQFSDEQQFNRDGFSGNQQTRNQQSRDMQTSRDQQMRRQQGNYQSGQDSWQQQDRFGNQNFDQSRSQSRSDNQSGRQEQSRGGQSSGDEAGLGVALNRSSREARVISVTQGSPAQRAGLRTGDEILSIDGEHVQSGQDVVWLIGQKDPGSWVEIEIRRNGSRQTVETQLASRQEALARGSSQFDQSRMSRSFSDDSSGQINRGQQFGQPMQRSGQYEQYGQSQQSRSMQPGDGNLQRQVQNLQRQVSSLQQEIDQLRSQLQGGRQTADRRSGRSSDESYEQESYRDGSSQQRSYDDFDNE